MSYYNPNNHDYYNLLTKEGAKVYKALDSMFADFIPNAAADWIEQIGMLPSTVAPSAQRLPSVEDRIEKQYAKDYKVLASQDPKRTILWTLFDYETAGTDRLNLSAFLKMRRVSVEAEEGIAAWLYDRFDKSVWIAARKEMLYILDNLERTG